MDDKSDYDDLVDQRGYNSRPNFIGKLFRFVVAAVTIFGLWMLFMPAPQHSSGRSTGSSSSGRTSLPNSRLPSHDEGSTDGQDGKIFLEAHIMYAFYGLQRDPLPRH